MTSITVTTLKIHRPPGYALWTPTDHILRTTEVYMHGHIDVNITTIHNHKYNHKHCDNEMQYITNDLLNGSFIS